MNGTMQKQADFSAALRRSEARADNERGAPVGLDALKIGAAAYIASVEAKGELRRRLMELGYFPGERVEKLLVSPLGDPSAYLVRGTVTAIRAGDAATVLVYGAENAAESASEVSEWV